jgi:hypothetical protein
VAGEIQRSTWLLARGLYVIDGAFPGGKSIHTSALRFGVSLSSCHSSGCHDPFETWTTRVK